LKRLVHFS